MVRRMCLPRARATSRREGILRVATFLDACKARFQRRVAGDCAVGVVMLVHTLDVTRQLCWRHTFALIEHSTSWMKEETRSVHAPTFCPWLEVGRCRLGVRRCVGWNLWASHGPSLKAYAHLLCVFVPCGEV